MLLENLGHDVVHGVHDYFRLGIMFLGLYSNFFILIPKEGQFVRVDQYWLITLDNFLFKVITKTVATRLGGIYSCILSHNQFSFISGYNIKGYLAEASEYFNAMHLPSYDGNFALKIDIRKEFNMLRWDFVLWVIKAFGFGKVFLGLIQCLFTFSHISILFSGSTRSYF